MSQIVLPQSQISYLSDGVSLRSWLLTTDHKRIAILYMISITFFFFSWRLRGGADPLQPDRA
jgi:hypothetical protein